MFFCRTWYYSVSYPSLCSLFVYKFICTFERFLCSRTCHFFKKAKLQQDELESNDNEGLFLIL